jgi:CRP-like cAMP-binding protein
MVTDTILCHAGRPYEYAYFPYSGYISVVVTVPEHKPLGINLIGYEGMLGATMVLGTRKAPMKAIVRGAGLAVRIPARKLEDELQANPGLRKIVGRYLYLLTTALARSSACTHFHQIEQRLARLLLLTHDRVQEDRFHLTHEYLADMLGVRRSGVTVAAGVLQRLKLIRYARGKITILERQRLEDASCGCYTADPD